MTGNQGQFKIVPLVGYSLARRFSAHALVGKVTSYTRIV